MSEVSDRGFGRCRSEKLLSEAKCWHSRIDGFAPETVTSRFSDAALSKNTVPLSSDAALAKLTYDTDLSFAGPAY